MSQYLFPDTTVLANFACVDRLDLLSAVLDGRGRWTAAVADEARRLERKYLSLARLPADGWLGEPIEITDSADQLQVERLRRAVFGGTSSQPLRHLGEAESCFVISQGSGFAGSWWISDDGEALRYAHRQGITARETIDLIRIAAVNGDVTADQGYELMHMMADHDRYLRLPGSPEALLR